MRRRDFESSCAASRCGPQARRRRRPRMRRQRYTAGQLIDGKRRGPLKASAVSRRTPPDFSLHVSPPTPASLPTIAQAARARRACQPRTSVSTNGRAGSARGHPRTLDLSVLLRDLRAPLAYPPKDIISISYLHREKRPQKHRQRPSLLRRAHPYDPRRRARVAGTLAAARWPRSCSSNDAKTAELDLGRHARG